MEHGPLDPVGARNEVFTSPLIHADETHWYLLDKGPGTKWSAWTVASPDTVFHRIYPSRSGATARTMLGDYAGVVLVDGDAAYQTATKSGADGPCPATLAFCWAHVRPELTAAPAASPARQAQCRNGARRTLTQLGRSSCSAC